MKQSMLLIFGILLNIGSIAQSCLPEGIIFSTQGQIDSFNINHPNCIEIEGNVTIYTYAETNITNLNGLILLTSIDGSLDIELGYPLGASYLTSLLGLEGLTTIGGSLLIHGNSALTSLAGLNNLTSIGESLSIMSNNSLTSLTGLSRLCSIGSDLIINGEFSLTILSGLEGLTSINGNLEIETNSNLINLIGLDNVNYIGGPIYIMNNHLTSLEGLDNLISTGGSITILDNESLISIAALGNLTSIGGFLTIKGTYHLTNLSGLNNLTYIPGYLNIDMNHALTSLIDLLGVSSIEGSLLIRHNDELTSLTGLDNINAGSISNLQIYSNGSLCNCAVQSICDYLSAPVGDFEIWNNANGCNSPIEVDSACTYLSTVDNHIDSALSIYPNPAFSQITVELDNSISRISTFLSIYNIEGKQLIKHDIIGPMTTVNVSGLNSGIYFVKIVDRDNVLVKKIVKN